MKTFGFFERFLAISGSPFAPSEYFFKDPGPDPFVIHKIQCLVRMWSKTVKYWARSVRNEEYGFSEQFLATSGSTFAPLEYFYRKSRPRSFHNLWKPTSAVNLSSLAWKMKNTAFLSNFWPLLVALLHPQCTFFISPGPDPIIIHKIPCLVQIWAKSVDERWTSFPPGANVRQQLKNNIQY